jgi:hypothetical protein
MGITEMDLKYGVSGFSWRRIVSGGGHGKDPAFSVKGGEFCDLLGDCHLAEISFFLDGISL